jgi:hypothetical protein
VRYITGTSGDLTTGRRETSQGRRGIRRQDVETNLRDGEGFDNRVVRYEYILYITGKGTSRVSTTGR